MTQGSSALTECAECHANVDGDSPAVGLGRNDGRASWIPFVQDLRTTGFVLVHPACFAAVRGVQALVDVVHEYDVKNRRAAFEGYVADPTT